MSDVAELYTGKETLAERFISLVYDHSSEFDSPTRIDALREGEWEVDFPMPLIPMTINAIRFKVNEITDADDNPSGVLEHSIEYYSPDHRTDGNTPFLTVTYSSEGMFTVVDDGASGWDVITGAAMRIVKDEHVDRIIGDITALENSGQMTQISAGGVFLNQQP